jgi:dTDP-4-dehydrorhamnose reductase
MKIIVTGANGMVARATIAHCAGIGDETLGFTRGELDIGDRSAVLGRIEKIQPDAVINCAAYTNVDGAESEPLASERANALGVGNLAEACRKVDARFVTISTDYVFDGRNPGFYTQRDTPEPLSVYGKTKLDGEQRARDAYARSIIVRSGWIYGNAGTNFLSVMHKLLGEGKQITAIADSYGTPTFAVDLAVRLRELAEIDLPGIYHVTNAGEGTSYSGFAEMVCEIGGFGKELVKKVSKDDLQRPAARPVSSKLACLFSERLGLAPMRKWDEALASFLDAERSAPIA